MVALYSAFRGQKIIVPGMPPKHVARPRLVAALDRAAERPLTLVAAGPACGKTVVLSEWAAARSGSERVAWVSLDAADNRETTFWSLVVDSARHAGILSEDVALEPLRSPAAGALELLGSAAQGGQPVHLVLDDAHVLTDPDLIASIDAVLRRPVPGLHLVMAARSDPLLPLHRYRMRDQLAELRAAEMAMTMGEVEELLSAHGVTLPAADRQLLADRTQGWVAAVRLSALRMEGTPDPGRFVSEFAVDRGSIGEFLLEEVLASLDATSRRLLIRTSSCEAVSGPLADAVCEVEGSDEVLARLAATNSFVSAVDHEGGWYRCHPLMREVLRHLLHREPSAVTRAIDARAARWHQSNGTVIEALTHASRAKEWSLVTSLLLDGGFERLFLRDGERSTCDLTAYLDLPVPADVVHRDDLLSAQAAVAATTGQHGAAARLLRDGGPAVVSREGRLLADHARLVLAARAGDEEGLEATAAATIDHDPHGAYGAFAWAELGYAHVWLGRDGEAQKELGQALSMAQSLALTALAVTVAGRLAIAHCSVGRVSAAQEAIASGAEMLRAHPELPDTATTALHVAEAEVAVTKGDLPAFERSLRLAQRKLDPDRDPALACMVALLRATSLQSAGRYAEARAVIHESPSCVAPGAWNLAAVSRTLDLELVAQAGRPQLALRSFAGHGPHRHDQIESMAMVAKARAHLAAGNLGEAGGLAQRVVAASHPAPSLPVLVQAVLVQSEVALATGDRPAAAEYAARAIELGSSEAVMLPFVEATPRLGELVRRHPGLAERWPVSLAPTPGEVAHHARVGIIETLTDREVSVLRWLPTTMTTAEIADELCVSTNTVKTHLASIYRKLGATKRREAVARGRALHLI